MDMSMRKEILEKIEDFLTLEFTNIEIRIENNGYAIIPTKTQNLNSKSVHNTSQEDNK